MGYRVDYRKWRTAHPEAGLMQELIQAYGLTPAHEKIKAPPRPRVGSDWKAQKPFSPARRRGADAMAFEWFLVLQGSPCRNGTFLAVC